VSCHKANCNPALAFLLFSSVTGCSNLTNLVPPGPVPRAELTQVPSVRDFLLLKSGPPEKVTQQIERNWQKSFGWLLTDYQLYRPFLEKYLDLPLAKAPKVLLKMDSHEPGVRSIPGDVSTIIMGIPFLQKSIHSAILRVLRSPDRGDFLKDSWRTNASDSDLLALYQEIIADLPDRPRASLYTFLSDSETSSAKERLSKRLQTAAFIDVINDVNSVYRNMILFLISHEMGHLALPPSEEPEIPADIFATILTTRSSPTMPGIAGLLGDDYSRSLGFASFFRNVFFESGLHSLDDVILSDSPSVAERFVAAHDAWQTLSNFENEALWVYSDRKRRRGVDPTEDWRPGRALGRDLGKIINELSENLVVKKTLQRDRGGLFILDDQISLLDKSAYDITFRFQIVGNSQTNDLGSFDRGTDSGSAKLRLAPGDYSIRAVPISSNAPPFWIRDSWKLNISANGQAVIKRFPVQLKQRLVVQAVKNDGQPGLSLKWPKALLADQYWATWTIIDPKTSVIKERRQDVVTTANYVVINGSNEPAKLQARVVALFYGVPVGESELLQTSY
jgi:hypothetical protein